MKITERLLRKIITEELEEARRTEPVRDDDTYEYKLYSKVVPSQDAQEDLSDMLYAAGLGDDDVEINVGKGGTYTVFVHRELPRSAAGKAAKRALDSYPDVAVSKPRGKRMSSAAAPPTASVTPAGTPVDLFDRKTLKRVPCSVYHDRKPGMETIVVLSIAMPPDGVVRLRAEDAQALAAALRGR